MAVPLVVSGSYTIRIRKPPSSCARGPAAPGSKRHEGVRRLRTATAATAGLWSNQLAKERRGSCHMLEPSHRPQRGPCVSEDQLTVLLVPECTVGLSTCTKVYRDVCSEGSYCIFMYRQKYMEIALKAQSLGFCGDRPGPPQSKVSFSRRGLDVQIPNIPPSV